MRTCWAAAVALVQDRACWKANVKAPDPIPGSLNGVQVMVGAYSNWTDPGVPCGVPHWVNVETCMSYWMSYDVCNCCLNAS